MRNAGFRAAVAAGDFQRAAALLDEFRRGLETVGAIEEALRTLEWAKRIAAAARSQAAVELQALSPPGAAWRPRSGRHTWEVRG